MTLSNLQHRATTCSALCPCRVPTGPYQRPDPGLRWTKTPQRNTSAPQRWKLNAVAPDQPPLDASFRSASLASIHCPSGGGSTGRVEDVALAAATGLPWSCWCQSGHDAWDALTWTLRNRSDLWHPIALAGGGQVGANLLVKRDSIYTLNFSELGVPIGAEALRLVMTPMYHPVTLTEVRQTLGGRQRLPSVMYLRPVTFGPEEGEPWSEVDFSVTVPWAPSTRRSRSHELLISAVSAFADADYKRAALDAHTAVDLALAEQTRELLQDVDAHRERFGPGQRMALAELVARTAGLPGITPQVRGWVRDLAQLRNGRAAHGGGDIDADDLVDPLGAAVALLWWIWRIGPTLRR